VEPCQFTLVKYRIFCLHCYYIEIINSTAQHRLRMDFVAFWSIIHSDSDDNGVYFTKWRRWPGIVREGSKILGFLRIKLCILQNKNHLHRPRHWPWGGGGRGAHEAAYVLHNKGHCMGWVSHLTRSECIVISNWEIRHRNLRSLMLSTLIYQTIVRSLGF